MRSTVAFIGLMLAIALPAPGYFAWCFGVLTVISAIMDIADLFA